MESAREDLLLETKRLLAALNDENKGLKTENTRLLAQCRAASEQLSRVRLEKEGLEKDLKHINFNLMQQLRVKLSALKEQEQLVTKMREKEAALESQLQASRLAQESSLKESAMHREQVVVLEGRLQQLTERLFRTEAEAGKYAEELNAAISGSREATAKIQQENAQRLKQMEETLRVSRNNEASLERIVEELRYELGRAKEALRHSHNSTNEDQRRTLSARTEILYAHEQVMTACSSSYQQLREVQQQLRAMENLVIDANRHMERTLEERETKLRKQTEEFIAADEVLVTFLCQRLTEREQALHSVREELSRAISRSKDFEKEINDAHAERRRHEAELETLVAIRQEIKTLRNELQECNSREEKLREEVARWRRDAESKELQAAEYKRLLYGEREQTEAARLSYEREVEGVDEQLREFTAIVSQALRRLDCTVQQQRRRCRLSSSAGGMTLSSALSTHSNEVARDSNASSPSVLRVESSPRVLGH